MENQIKKDYRAREARRPQRQYVVPAWRVLMLTKRNLLNCTGNPYFKKNMLQN